MRKLILVLMLLKTSEILFAQNIYEEVEPRPLNNVTLNFIGDASLVSINYERQFLVTPNFIISSRIGIGHYGEFSLCSSLILCTTPPAQYLTIPHHITGNLGKGKHFFEFGFGGVVIDGNTPQPYIFYPVIGYRILPLLSKEISFRLFVHIPFSGIEVDGIFFIPAGISVGLTF
jgi:hypothetical protein